MLTLTVINWSRWQSYRSDRGQPPWIKVHRTILRNPEWTMLTDSQRGQLVQIWILAADKGGRIESPDSVNLETFIQSVCCMKEEPNLQVLSDLGFIKVKHGVKVTPRRRQRTTPTRRQADATVTPQSRVEKSRVETETETEVQIASRRAGTKPAEVLDAGILIFPTVGTKAQQWPLTQAHLDEWTALYPGLDVLAECRKALAWVQANDLKRKTPGGMKTFLVKWLNRSTDSPRATGPHPYSKTAGNKAAAEAYLEGRLDG